MARRRRPAWPGPGCALSIPCSTMRTLRPPGASLEQCLAREVHEEVGVRVANIRYFASQPWPFPHSLMIAFVAEWRDGEIAPQAGEIEDAKWFDVLHLPKLPSRISIARRLIDSVCQALVEQANEQN